ncbi:MAG: hypothetical protein ACRDSL_04335 [Pseudonocardiaceae bacterium]
MRRLAYVAAGVRPVQTRAEWTDTGTPGSGRPAVSRDRPEPPWPVVGSPAWWTAREPVRIAALLVLAESWLVADPEQQIRQRLRQVSHAISEGMDWSAAAHHLAYEPHRVVARRRAELGPLARQVDPEALARWVETGSSDKDGTAA